MKKKLVIKAYHPVLRLMNLNQYDEIYTYESVFKKLIYKHTAKQIIITGSLTTTGGGDASVKIYDGYYIEIKLAARAVLTTQ